MRKYQRKKCRHLSGCACVCVQIAWEGKLSNPFVGIWRQYVTEECYVAHMYIHTYICVCVRK